MVVNKVVLLRIFALAMMLAGAAWQPVRAEDAATQHAVTAAVARVRPFGS